MASVESDDSDHESDSIESLTQLSGFDEPGKDEQRAFREKRQNYRDLICEIKENENEAADELEIGDRITQLRKINSLFEGGNGVEGVKRMRELAYDAEAVNLFTTREFLNISRLQTNLVKFNELELCEKILTFMDVNRIEGEGEENRPTIIKESWLKLGHHTSSIFKKSPPFHFMYGSFEVDAVAPKKRQVRERNVRDKAGPTVKPQEIKNLDQKDRDKTTEEVENVYAILNRVFEKNDNNPICYFKFCIDPSSFAMTVENIFFVSFLIKDGLASLCLSEHGLPVIAPVSKKESADDKKAKQIVITIDISEFKELIEVLKINKATIKRKTL